MKLRKQINVFKIPEKHHWWINTLTKKKPAVCDEQKPGNVHSIKEIIASTKNNSN